MCYERMNIKLRAHHLLCLHSFSGKGYDERFIANMNRVKKMFLANPEMLIEIVAELDMVCDACPHLRDTGCVKDFDAYEEIRIKELDRKVIALAGLKEGHIINVKDAFESVEKAVRSEMLRKICRNCEWLEIGNCRGKIEIPFFG